MVARDVYGKHYRELRGETFRDAFLIDFIALAVIETEEARAGRP